MDLIKAKQAGVEILESAKFDLVVVASGFEERCTWLVSKYNIHTKSKIAVSWNKKHFEIFKSGNNKILKDKGFSFIDMAVDDSSSLVNFFESYLSEKKDEELNILIDYSGMTKLMFFGILNFFSLLENSKGVFHLYFSYIPVAYQKIKKPKTIRVAESIIPNARMKNSEKPNVLIIGLGLQAGKAEYIRELIKPDKTILLYPDPAPNECVDLIFENNKKVIGEVEMRNMINYPYDDLNSTIDILTNLVLDLRLQSNIILAPLGPKSFALATMIINIYYPDVDIWRVSSDIAPSDLKQQAFLSPVVLELTFSELEEE